MRLFVAAYPSAAALDDLADQISTMHVGRAAAAGVNARVTARQLWHLTLAFLGDVADDRRDDVVGAVEAAAQRFDGSPPMVRLAGGGTFGRGRFALLWVGADGDVAGLGSLAGTVRAELRRARLPFDHKPFRAHLTIARPGDRIAWSDLRDDVANLSTYQGPWWTLTDITLVESHLGPHPRHDPLSVQHVG